MNSKIPLEKRQNAILQAGNSKHTVRKPSVSIGARPRFSVPDSCKMVSLGQTQSSKQSLPEFGASKPQNNLSDYPSQLSSKISKPAFSFSTKKKEFAHSEAAFGQCMAKKRSRKGDVVDKETLEHELRLERRRLSSKPTLGAMGGAIGNSNCTSSSSSRSRSNGIPSEPCLIAAASANSMDQSRNLPGASVSKHGVNKSLPEPIRQLDLLATSRPTVLSKNGQNKRDTASGSMNRRGGDVVSALPTTVEMPLGNNVRDVPSSLHQPAMMSRISNENVAANSNANVRAGEVPRALSHQPAAVATAGVSENFVRRNLKKRFGNYTKSKPTKKLVHYSHSNRIRTENSSFVMDENVGAADPQWGERKMPHEIALEGLGGVATLESDTEDASASVTHGTLGRKIDEPPGRRMGAQRGEANKCDQKGGLSGLGLDSLQLAIDTFACSDADGPQAGESVAKSSAQRSRNNSANRTVQQAHTSYLDKFSGTSTQQQLPRGLKDPKARSAAAVARAKKVHKRYGGCDDDKLTELAPLCSGHNFAAKLLKVKKEGQNKGRKFYGCAFPEDQRCKFFLWAEDNPAIVSLIAEHRAEEAAQLAGLTEAEVWMHNALKSYDDRLHLMTREELNAEVRKCKQRRAMRLAGGKTGSRGGDRGVKDVVLKVSGSRTEVTQRLLEEARNTLMADRAQCAELVHMDAIDGDANCPESGPSEEAHHAANDVRCRRVKRAAPRKAIIGECHSHRENSPLGMNLRRNDDENEEENKSVQSCYSGGSDFDSMSDCQSESESTDSVMHASDDNCDEMEAEIDAQESKIDAKIDSLSDDDNNDDDDDDFNDDDDDGDIDGDGDDDFEDLESCGDDAVIEMSGSEYSDEATEKEEIELTKKPKRAKRANTHEQQSADKESTSLKPRGSQGAVSRKGRNRGRSKNSANVDFDASVSLASLSPVERMLRVHFGFTEFRTGQRWAIDRAIGGFNSLLVMPTGAGKSLCYMLPALALRGLTIVVSPLISLMQDQLKKLPVELPGGVLSSAMSAIEAAELTASVLQGHVKVLFVSPERLCSASFRNLMRLLKANHEAKRMHLYRSSAVYESDKAGAHADETSANACELRNTLHAAEEDESHAVSLLCLDEAHCLSQWSYNFRPAFLRISREIQHVRPRAILALTATAPAHVQSDIMSHLHIAPSGLCALSPRRDNLHYYAVELSSEDIKRRALLEILKCPDDMLAATLQQLKEADGMGKNGRRHTTLPPCRRGGDAGNDDDDDRRNMGHKGRRKRDSRQLASQRGKSDRSSGSIVPLSIVYVGRRDEADSLAEYIKACGIGAVSYHAGMDTDQRERAQQSFFRGTVKVIVATIAFGMGIDKSDIRRVLHYTVPRSVESFIQETGRAGRDSLPASCVLFMSIDDVVRQASLAHSNRVSRLQLAGLLKLVFRKLSSVSGESIDQSTSANLSNHAHHSRAVRQLVCLPLSAIERTLDIPQNVAETALSVLELEPYSRLCVDGVHNDALSGQFRVSPNSPQLQHDRIVRAILTLNDARLAEERLRKAEVAAGRKTTAKVRGYVGASNDDDDDDDDVGAECTKNNATSFFSNDLDGRFNERYASFKKEEVGAGPGSQKAQLSYSKIEFSVSIAAIMEATQMPRDEVGKALWVLQKRGVLQYGLGTPALYAHIHNHVLGELAALSAEVFRDWVWELSGSVHQRMMGIDAENEGRIVSMWGLGNQIAERTVRLGRRSLEESECEAAGSGAEEGQVADSSDRGSRIGDVAACRRQGPCHEDVRAEAALVQETIRATICSHLDDRAEREEREKARVASTTDSGNTAADSPSLSPSSSPLTTLSLRGAGGDGAGQWQEHECVDGEQREQKTVRADALALHRQPAIVSLVRYLQQSVSEHLIARASGHVDGRGEDVAALSALLIGRVFHGLPTSLLPADLWRDCGYWGRYKHIAFGSLVAYIENTLPSHNAY